LVHELSGGNSNVRFGTALGKSVTDAKCNAVPDQQTRYQTEPPCSAAHR
jgi:hypothetical protein